MREWLMRLVDMFRRDRLDAELAEELRHHRGLAARDGHRADSDLRTREAAREQWSWPWLDHFLQDARYALRGLRRSPGFTLAVTLTLGLGIGANVVMFGVLDQLMFRSFPGLRDPDLVHRVYIESQGRGGGVFHSTYEYTRYLDLRRWTSSFALAAGISEGSTAVGVGESARERRVARVSGTFFDFFDARPALGRFFGPPEDSVPSGSPVAVLSHGFWQAEYGGRPEVLGTPLQVGNVLATIIGVAPPGFTGVWDGAPPAVYIPITAYASASGGPDDRTSYYTRYNWGWMRMMVRRKPGVSVEAASADLTAALARSWDAERAIDPEVTQFEIAKPRAIAASLKSGAGPEANLEAKTARWVMGVAVIVLLVACANVTNLLLARYLRRRREMAVRLALGVGRGRLLRQSLTECLFLAGLGGAAALLISVWGGAAIRRLFTTGAGPAALLQGQPSTLDAWRDGRMLIAGLGIALAAGLLTALATVLLTPRDHLTLALKGGAREGSVQHSRARTALLVLQGALSVLLLVGAGLFVRSLGRVRDMRLGYEPEQVLVAVRNMRGTQLTEAERVTLAQRLLETAEAIPGVEAASLASSIPFWGNSSTDLFVAGIDSVRRLGRFTYQEATPGYFTTMRSGVVRGRGITEADRAGAPRVMVVSESMARTIWPGRDAIGECIRVQMDTMPCTTVVGIAEDAVQVSMSSDSRLNYYMPMAQRRPDGGRAILLRVRGDPAGQAEPVRKALQAVMPGLSYVSVFPLREVVAGERRSWQSGATMFVAFGGLALLVAAVGLYGVIAYNVAQRMHELGVRIALGARAEHVVRLVVAQGVRVAAAGVLIGLLVSLAVARWIEPLLFRQPARDPLTYSIVAALLLLVALVASAVPALRATRADPNAALRSD